MQHQDQVSSRLSRRSGFNAALVEVGISKWHAVPVAPWPVTANRSPCKMVVRSPVEPDPPVGDVVLGEQEAAEQQHDQEEEGAAGGCNVLVTAQRALEAKQREAHAVQQEEQQHEREEPAQQAEET